MIIEKTYPNIYSLSTLGVIHHYNCDYLFHHLRTDFTGESGSGKSMIGDFLQLIFVGSKFASSTIPLHGENEREIKTIVYSKGNKTANAYIFLNIEMKPDQFLVIGVFIKSSSNIPKHFIIQNGYDKEKPEFLNKPLIHSDLLFDNTIFELSEIDDLLKNHYCIEYRVDIFAKKLKDFEVIPYNLETEEQRNNFSIIIRAFARGKGLKTNNSDSLIKFLFDDNSEKEIIKFWREGVEKIEKEVKNFYKTQAEIDEITERANKIKRLKKYENDYNTSKLEYLISQCFYFNEEVNSETEELKKKKQKLTKLMIKQHFFVEKIYLKEKENKEKIIGIISDNRKRIEKIDKEIEELNKTDIKKELKIIKDNLEKLADPYSNIIKVAKWTENRNIETLKEYHDKQKEIEKQKIILADFITYLESKNIQKVFNSSLFSVNYSKAINKNKKLLEKYIIEIVFLETIKKISNPKDKSSLASWAINKIEKTKNPFDKTEESLLVYLQKLPREKNIQKNEINRYLNKPDTLFNSLEITEETDDGFWISLKGINEFIPYYSEKQILNTTDIDKIKNLFSEKYQKVDKLLKRYKKKQTKRETLISYLEDYQNKEVFKIYPNKEELLKFKIISGLTENFEQKLTDFKNKETINTKKEKLEKEQTKYKNTDTQIQKLSKEKEELLEYLKTNKQNETLKDIEKLRKKINKEDKKINLYKNKTELYDSIYVELVNDIKQKKSIEELKGENKIAGRDGKKQMLKTYRNLKLLINNFDNAKNSYFEKTGKNFSPAETDINDEKTTEDLKEEFSNNKKIFTKFYDDDILDLIPDNKKDEYRKQYNVASITIEILPEVYTKQKVITSKIIDQVNTYLDDINKINADINTRHIKILHQAFRKTYSKYSEYIESYDSIKNFFSKQDFNKITGGNKVVLNMIENITDYRSDFLVEIRKTLDNEINKTGLLEALQKKSIEELIEEIYKRVTGKSMPKIENLLNPKKYFSLEFKMTGKKGKLNIGSTGQTTTALALLCIARLSELHKDDNNKELSGIRFMPLDEALDLGSNFDILYNIAIEKKYQIISMSIYPLENMQDEAQYWYMLNENPNEESKINYPPFAVFSNKEGEIKNVSKKIEYLINE